MPLMRSYWNTVDPYSSSPSVLIKKENFTSRHRVVHIGRTSCDEWSDAATSHEATRSQDQAWTDPSLMPLEEAQPC